MLYSPRVSRVTDLVVFSCGSNKTSVSLGEESVAIYANLSSEGDAIYFSGVGTSSDSKAGLYVAVNFPSVAENTYTVP